jgi:DNA topoisomerase-3
VLELNWLEVFTYERWSDSYIPHFKEGEKFAPTSFRMEESETSAPKLLTESDLITLMDKNGIGTDATIHEHIKTVQERNYAVKVKTEFKPTAIGVSLVEVYQAIGIHLYKPALRAQMEKEMNMIANGTKPKREVLNDAIEEMHKIFHEVVAKKYKMIEVLTEKFNKSSNDDRLKVTVASRYQKEDRTTDGKYRINIL